MSETQVTTTPATPHGEPAGPKLYGVMADFIRPEEVVAAARAAYAAGYRNMDAYSPFPVDGLAEAIGFTRNRMPLVVLIGGICGGLFAYWMQWYTAVVDYPINVAGRPYHSWPAFIPITFELTVLGAAAAAVLGMLGLNGLPRPHHPVFNVPRFALASRSRFFLCIQAIDPQFDHRRVREFLAGLNPREINDVAS
jgi:hypothetical protein